MVTRADGRGFRATATMRAMAAALDPHAALREHLALDDLVVTLGERFRDIPLTQLDQTLDDAVRLLGERAGIDRVHVGLLEADDTVAVSAHEWCAGGVSPPNPRGLRVSAATLPYTLAHLRRGQPIVVPEVDALPAEAREEVAEYHPPGVRSLCLLPLRDRAGCIGYLGCETVRGPRAWDAGWITLVQLVADVFAGAIVRKRWYAALRDGIDRARDRLDSAPVGVYRTTPGGRILYVNATLVKLLGFATFQDLVRHPLGEANYHPSYPRQQFIQRIEAAGEIRDLVSTWSRKDGSAVKVREHAKAIRGPEGVTRYYEGIVEAL